MSEEPRRAERRTRPKDWRHMGEVDAGSRPRNSLAAGGPVEYERARPTGAVFTKEDREMLALLRERVREKRFDNFEYDVCRREEEACPEDAAEHADAGQEVDRDKLEGLFLEIKGELDALTSACGAWHSTDTRVYEEKRSAPEEKTAVRTRGRDAKSMRVLKKARNVKMLR